MPDYMSFTDAPIAHHDTLLGQMQRGLGRGYLNALNTPGSSDLLLQCIEHDPRWDPQLEDRQRYYARLAIELNVCPSSVAAIYRANPSYETDVPSLAAWVLAELVARGSAEAREQISMLLHSPHWQNIFSAVAEIESEYELFILTDADLLYVSQNLDDHELEDLIDPYDEERLERWADLSARHHRIAASVRRRHDERMQEHANTMPDASMSTEALLRQISWQTYLNTIPLLDSRRDPGSVELLIAATRSSNRFVTGAAFRVLGRQHNTTLLDKVCRALERDPGGPTSKSTAFRPFYFRYLEGLPAFVTLPLAREWLNSPGARRMAAHRILECHATPAERAMVEDTLSAALEGEADYFGVYRACSMIDALASIADPRSTDLLERAFYQLPYCQARPRVFKALKASGSEAGVDLGRESLWDSNDEVRELAMTLVKRAPVVAARIREMSLDPCEYADARNAARAWLGDSYPRVR
ncbi:hypothetical protein EA187_17375 [Lujinxingia sediminis]|uniref:HEAT repeat domain-containing protein n=1 Tax=Lujinxingia sediminis TaxID=2480984 RepID=A0ABY0CNS8_9DELT|nr:hypothetical protein [Lujinxingia sediminis]RVU42110.1 hypothetical protein EA187_17375 [Lujinxingia sediminis]